MEEIKMKTRFEEVSFPTSDPNEMNGRYLAEDARREWEEDFLDETTGELVKVTRYELVMKRGEFLSPDNISSLSFYLRTGDIKAVDSIENEEKYNWKQAMDYCKEHGLELPSKDDALILLWQFDKINALLRSMGKPEISKESWFWTKTESSATYAWYWLSSDLWYNSSKNNSHAVVPFFAID